LYLDSLEQFEEVIDRITDVCEVARRKLDDLEKVAIGLSNLASSELDIENTDWKRVKEQIWTMFGGNGKQLDRLENNMRHLRDTIKFGGDARKVLSDASYTLNGLKASISAIRKQLTTALNSGDVFEAEIQYGAIAYGLTRLADIHNRGFGKDEADNHIKFFLSP
jgi:hypothetical protein